MIEKMKRKFKNINQTDLLELLEQLEQLEEVESELNMTSSLGQLELSIMSEMIEKQIDWVGLDTDLLADTASSGLRI